jgi:hypothetical protein
VRILLALALAWRIAGAAQAGGSGVTGVLRDEAGRSLAGARVLACMTKVCLIGETDARGKFTFHIDPAADIVIKTDEDLSARPRRGAAMLPVRLADSRMVDVGPVYVPTLPAGQPFGPGAADGTPIEIGDGLQLTLDRRALKAPPGHAILDVAARRLPASRVPAYAPLARERVVDVYALHPFAASSAAPIAVRAPSRLPPGTRVKFWTIDEIDGTFSTPVPGTATGTYVATDAAAGITRLTYLVISR